MRDGRCLKPSRCNNREARAFKGAALNELAADHFTTSSSRLRGSREKTAEIRKPFDEGVTTRPRISRRS